MRCTLPPTGRAAAAAARHGASVPVLETDRLRLRAPDLRDLPAWTEVYLCDGAFLGGAKDAEAAWTEFSYYTAGWMLHGHGLWSVEHRETGALLGFVLLGLEWGDDEPELGYLFLEDARGQGFAAEAAAAARDYGLTLLDSFVSYIDPDNSASNRLADRLGAIRDTGAEAGILASDGARVHVWRHGADRGARQ